MKIVYIAHPIGGDVKGNIDKILAIIKQINFFEADVVPFAPYIPDCLACDDSNQKERERCIKNDRELFNRKFIDEVWLYGDKISTGMKAEIELAVELNIPIKAMMSELHQELWKIIMEHKNTIGKVLL